MVGGTEGVRPTPAPGATHEAPSSSLMPAEIFSFSMLKALTCMHMDMDMGRWWEMVGDGGRWWEIFSFSMLKALTCMHVGR